jgi:hypothetical protein
MAKKFGTGVVVVGFGVESLSEFSVIFALGIGKKDGTGFAAAASLGTPKENGRDEIGASLPSRVVLGGGASGKDVNGFVVASGAADTVPGGCELAAAGVGEVPLSISVEVDV